MLGDENGGTLAQAPSAYSKNGHPWQQHKICAIDEEDDEVGGRVEQWTGWHHHDVKKQGVIYI